MSDETEMRMGRVAVVGLSLALPLMGFGKEAARAVDTYPYGVAAHVTRSEGTPSRLKGTIATMRLAGLRYVRSDIDAHRVLRPDGTYDYAVYDPLVSELETHGIRLLPIIYGYKPGAWNGAPEDLARQEEYVRSFVAHYGLRVPVVEIWNEANIEMFLTNPDPVRYAEILKASYRGAKRANPRVRVAFTGTAGVPLDWIRAVFKAGAVNSFDVMNVHPYSHPGAPEGSLDVNVEKLRALMNEFGCGDRPIWITEIGWPTHSASIEHASILLAGLKTARPEQKSWRVVVADNAMRDSDVDLSLAENLLDLLPPGSEARACSQPETCRRLAAGDVDAVVYPIDMTFPAETVEAVNAFIAKGGVFVDFGGIPCYYGRIGADAPEGMEAGGAMLSRFPFGYRAWWNGGKGVYPEASRVFATEVGLRAGVRQEPTGFAVRRFLVPDRAGSESEWIPLVAGKTNDVDLVAAAVIRYRGARTGAAVLCSLERSIGGVAGTNTEENQARFTARALGLSFAEGVEAYFPYNLRASEENPGYSEHHFGLMHANFVPKPAYSAYANFTRERPAGSRQTETPWHNAARTLFFPQWTRPTGVSAGMVWTPGALQRLTMRFVGGRPTFRDMYGRKIAVRELGDGSWCVPVSVSPTYFSGAALVPPLERAAVAP